MKKKWVRECNGWWLIERTKSMLEKDIVSYLHASFCFFNVVSCPWKFACIIWLIPHRVWWSDRAARHSKTCLLIESRCEEWMAHNTLTSEAATVMSATVTVISMRIAFFLFVFWFVCFFSISWWLFWCFFSVFGMPKKALGGSMETAWKPKQTRNEQKEKLSPTSVRSSVSFLDKTMKRV